MKSLRRLQYGYTVTEVVIVLSISAALFLTAITGFRIQNNRTEFNQAVRELDLKVQDVLNDVATGYYPNGGNIMCERSGGATPEPRISGAVTGQGTNNQCIFVGRAFDFRNLDNDQTDEIYTIIGLTHKASDPDEKEPSTNVDDASNRAIVDRFIDGAVDPYTRHGSIQISRVADTATSTALDGFAIISAFGTGDGVGSNRASIAKIEGYDFNNEHVPVVDAGSDLNRVIALCIEEAGGGPGARRATIKIGDGSLTNIQTIIDASDAEWAAAGCA